MVGLPTFDGEHGLIKLFPEFDSASGNLADGLTGLRLHGKNTGAKRAAMSLGPSEDQRLGIPIGLCALTCQL